MAKYTAQWGSKGFLVSPSKVVPLLNVGTGYARKSDTNEDTSGTPTTNTRGLELQTITLETRYLAGAGVDPRAQMEDWKKQFGQRHPLYINGQLFGPKLLELDSVDFSNILLDNLGRFLQVDVSITLVEYVPPTTTVSSKNATTSSKSSSSAGAETSATSTSGTKAGALSAKASTTDKAAKKYTPVRSKNT